LSSGVFGSDGLVSSIVGSESGSISAQLVQGTHGTQFLQPGGIRVAVGHAWIVDVAVAVAVAAGGLIVQTQLWVLLLLLLLLLWVLIAQLQNLQTQNARRAEKDLNSELLLWLL